MTQAFCGHTLRSLKKGGIGNVRPIHTTTRGSSTGPQGAGLLAGFPAAAVSCASRRFGEFEVSAYRIGVLIRHTKRYGKVALDAFLMADGSGRMAIALYTTGAIPDGTLLDVLYRFNDGTVHSDHGDEEPDVHAGHGPASCAANPDRTERPAFRDVPQSPDRHDRSAPAHKRRDACNRSQCLVDRVFKSGAARARDPDDLHGRAEPRRRAPVLARRRRPGVS